MKKTHFALQRTAQPIPSHSIPAQRVCECTIMGHPRSSTMSVFDRAHLQLSIRL